MIDLIAEHEKGFIKSQPNADTQDIYNAFD